MKVVEPFSATDQEKAQMAQIRHGGEIKIVQQQELLPPPFNINENHLQLGKITTASPNISSLESIDVIASPVKIVEGSCLVTSHADLRGREV